MPESLPDAVVNIYLRVHQLYYVWSLAGIIPFHKTQIILTHFIRTFALKNINHKIPVILLIINDSIKYWFKPFRYTIKYKRPIKTTI